VIQIGQDLPLLPEAADADVEPRSLLISLIATCWQYSLSSRSAR